MPPVQQDLTPAALLLSGQPQHCSTWYGGGAAVRQHPAPGHSSLETMTQEPYPTLAIGRQLPKIDCPKHGIHSHTIESTIPGHEGHWCQLCWLESLGEPLPVIE